jgi:hypothetical protein
MLHETWWRWWTIVINGWNEADSSTPTVWRNVGHEELILAMVLFLTILMCVVEL